MNKKFIAIEEAITLQPFTSYIGAKLNKVEEGSAELILRVADDLKQQHGFVHGGVLSYLADNCITCAAATVLGDCVTSEYKINYVRPAKGENLRSEASVLSFGKHQAICECRIFSSNTDKEILVAVAQGTIHKISKKEAINSDQRRQLFQQSF